MDATWVIWVPFGPANVPPTSANLVPSRVAYCSVCSTKKNHPKSMTPQRSSANTGNTKANSTILDPRTPFA
jgi:hypothetical protein